ncbi:OST-HTH/LOTUS domain-containing protein [Brumicola pallidula]|uniref:HTH OST-type domain-containing protein n=1 Tax=Brumicola pallidula DSM 14239 = ACAM 615 TaxID=1121922 RepID=K6ZC06_9ALTE|nr:OST-HTH/LOTUS domain-containing protein [Glaciecola pallidula]GAC27867.1 hypothetical protein GPAL_0988 [Glaciecola pallidula DSM 14239 = ACAM 615]
MSLEESVNEVLRKIGRNMMLFQHLEHLLKYVVANGKFSGFKSELEDIKVKQAATINSQTMGQLVGQYIETTHSISEAREDELQDGDETYFSFSFSFESDAVYYETKKADLANLVSERNELVHHLLPSFNTDSVASCEALGNKLEKQSKRIRQEIEEIRAIAMALNEGRKELSDFLVSEEGKKQITISFLRQSRLVILLGDIASQMAREDGWTLMGKAGLLLREHAPEEIAQLKERYGHKTLRSLILATEIFDIFEESTEKGARVLYRLKAGWALSHTEHGEDS